MSFEESTTSTFVKKVESALDYSISISNDSNHNNTSSLLGDISFSSSNSTSKSIISDDNINYSENFSIFDSPSHSKVNDTSINEDFEDLSPQKSFISAFNTKYNVSANSLNDVFNLFDILLKKKKKN